MGVLPPFLPFPSLGMARLIPTGDMGHRSKLMDKELTKKTK
ncbi:hypothetical protein [Calothrix sp. FACHB-168]|nr:hypothetical protein [Calothrix sp. FACHB-168]